MSKKAYDAAFAVLKTQNEIICELENAGLSFEYGTGFWGKTLESLLNNCENIIKESLNLQEKTIFPDRFTEVDVLYTGEYDANWIVTEEDFCDFIFDAFSRQDLRELFWEAMVDKDEAAKEVFNMESRNCQIGKKLEGLI